MPARKPTPEPVPETSPWEDLEVQVLGGRFDDHLTDLAETIGKRFAMNGTEVVWWIDGPDIKFHQDDLTLDMLDDVKEATDCPAVLVSPNTFAIRPDVLRALIAAVLHHRDGKTEEEAVAIAGALSLRKVMRTMRTGPADPQGATAPS